MADHFLKNELSPKIKHALKAEYALLAEYAL
jgi:hypothetical protein